MKLLMGHLASRARTGQFFVVLGSTNEQSARCLLDHDLAHGRGKNVIEMNDWQNYDGVGKMNMEVNTLDGTESPITYTT